MLATFNLTTTLWGRYYYCPHFPGEKYEAQTGHITCLSRGAMLPARQSGPRNDTFNSFPS